MERREYIPVPMPAPQVKRLNELGREGSELAAADATHRSLKRRLRP